MKPMTRLRFDALAGYSRSPIAALTTGELAWYQEADEKLLGLIALDLADEDYVSYVLGRDAKGRFRAVWLECSIETKAQATEILERKLIEYSQLPQEEFHQGDEVGKPVDFFTPVGDANRLHPLFVVLNSNRGYAPARGLIGELMHYFEDADGNFVQQFQTDGFDARIWELYLYAALHELGYGFDRTHAVPDFHCWGALGEFFVEATTVNRPGVLPEPDSGREAYFEHYVPLRYGSVLTTKLQKEDWQQPHVAGYPYILAVQDFHAPYAMAWSNSALVEYLYGIRQTERLDPEGKTEIVSEKITEYKVKGKSPIPAGFFLLPDSENVSAVLANPSGTLAKFNRMGFLAGFGNRKIRMFRRGYCYKGALTAEPFNAEVHSPAYEETWCEGLSIYHNPAARIPLARETFPSAAHHTSRDGRILAVQPPFHPVGSITYIVAPASG